jgi:hypothetical protein
MHPRTLLFSLAPLLAAPLAPLAQAQAPGEVPPQVVVAPVIAPVIVAPPTAAPAPAAPYAPYAPAAPAVICRESVMAQRWSIGLSIGSMSLAPESAPERDTQFAVGELALRFRATRRLELELSLGGGREQTADHQEGDHEVAAGALAARFRFRPEAAWNWFAMVGVGGAAITRHDATDQEREDAMQPLGMLGIGVERRFRRFALQAEARAIGIGEEDRDEVMATADTTEMAVVAPELEQPQAGGAVTIGLSYYF